MLDVPRHRSRRERLLSVRHEGRDGEGWMISYIDIMTLLVTLFVLLLTLSGKFGVLAAVAGGGVADGAPAVPVSETAARVAVAVQAAPAAASPRFPLETNRVTGIRVSALLAPPRLTPTALASARLVAGPMLSPVGTPPPRLSHAAITTAERLSAASPVRLDPAARDAALRVAEAASRPLPVINGVEVSRVKGGINLRIQDHLLFGSGDAALTGGGREMINQLVAILQRYDGEISVEGHTDSVPIDTPRFPSNWELSSARATAILRYLVQAGIDPERLRAVGYADTRPLQSNRTAAGRAANRRVEVIIHAPEAH
ncbi:OmpA family protein [Modicisalibacter tunisiensis]|uniref:OmpA family protein n=1 Tax=Modicisalibacter tunisiensis TaxID=390637 RepID=UPI001CCDE20F|nr:OmpA family protein [Modicisalibacter tunisiensis]MBZ9538004.1 OmpA family protein [Modicisalibacter tunisiensis]